ncbi:hypothetical protein SEPCBS57363_004166 [Sporothrix epigloea]|uniref:Uncharacterized protein n=1 Tax=Sporothrix epigloea TaxID=1892477 RepID=A0ABP0DQI6_9PEZI
MSTTMMILPMCSSSPDSPERLSRMAAFAHSPFRPSRPSPLSSSPIQGCSSLPSASHMKSMQSDTQSSPIQQSSSAALMFGASTRSLPDINACALQHPQPFSDLGDLKKGPTFRFASRPAKPVPRSQISRDAAQQTRRTLFLRNVRQRADDHNWNRRNLEQEKLEWWSLERELRQARELDVMSMLTDQDIEDAEDWVASPIFSQPSSSLSLPFEQSKDARRQNNYYDRAANDERGNEEDERMVELLMREEEAEMEALIASMENSANAGFADDGSVPPPERPDSAVYSEDADYDTIFSEILSGVGEDTEMGMF